MGSTTQTRRTKVQIQRWPGDSHSTGAREEAGVSRQEDAGKG